MKKRLPSMSNRTGPHLPGRSGRHYDEENFSANIFKAGDRNPGPGKTPAPERVASASSQAPLTASSITPEDQAVLDAADEWIYDLVRLPRSLALRKLYTAAWARVPESKRTKKSSWKT